MKKLLIVLLVTFFAIPSWGAFSEDDKKQFNDFNKEYQSLSNDMRAVRGPQKWLDANFVSEVDARFLTLNNHIKALSDPSDRNARSLQSSYDSLYGWYQNILNKAKAWGAKNQPSQQAAATTTPQVSQNKAAEVKPSQASADTGPLDFQSKRALQFFEKDYKRYQPYFAEAKADNEREMREYIEKLENKLSNVPMQDHPETQSAAAKVEELKAALMKALGRDPGSYAQGPQGPEPLSSGDESNLRFFEKEYYNNQTYFSELDPISLQDPNKAAPLQKTLDNMAAIFAKVENSGHPKVQEAKSRYQALADKLADAMKEGEEAAGKAGDIDAQLDMAQEQFPMPDWNPSLADPKTPARIKAWAGDLKNWREAVPQVLDFFKTAEGLSVKARSKEFQAYARWFKGQIVKNIDYAIKETRDRWALEIQGPLNPGKLDDANLQNEGRVAAIISMLGTAEELLEKLTAFDQGYYGQAQSDTEQNKEKLAGLWEKLKTGRERAIANARMPKSATDNAELRSIAERLAKDPKYAFKPYLRLVVNYDKHSFEKLNWYDGAWYKIKWDEFQATIAEEDGGKVWMRPLTIRYYYSGEPKTPLNKWIVGDSFRGAQILKENIDK